MIAMTRAGVGDELIISQIRVHGVAAQLMAPDIIMLKQQGVSERVIQAMQTLPPPQAVMVAPPPPPQTVIVEEPYYHRPYYYGGGYYRRPAVSVGVGF